MFFKISKAPSTDNIIEKGFHLKGGFWYKLENSAPFYTPSFGVTTKSFTCIQALSQIQVLSIHQVFTILTKWGW